MPAFDLRRAGGGQRAVGKAVVFARRDVVVGDTHTWLAEEHANIRDIPHPGEAITAGRPVCTVFAAGANGVAFKGDGMGGLVSQARSLLHCEDKCA